MGATSLLRKTFSAVKELGAQMSRRATFPPSSPLARTRAMSLGPWRRPVSVASARPRPGYGGSVALRQAGRWGALMIPGHGRRSARSTRANAGCMDGTRRRVFLALQTRSLSSKRGLKMTLRCSCVALTAACAWTGMISRIAARHRASSPSSAGSPRSRAG